MKLFAHMVLLLRAKKNFYAKEIRKFIGTSWRRGFDTFKNTPRDNIECNLLCSYWHINLFHPHHTHTRNLLSLSIFKSTPCTCKNPLLFPFKVSCSLSFIWKLFFKSCHIQLQQSSNELIGNEAISFSNLFSLSMSRWKAQEK